MSKHVCGWWSGRTIFGSLGGCLGWLWLTLLMAALQHGGVVRGGNPVSISLKPFFYFVIDTVDK